MALVTILIGMLMCCHLPLAYDSLGRYSINPFVSFILSYQSMIKLLHMFSHVFLHITRELLLKQYFHMSVAVQCISFDAYVGIATYGFLIAVNLYLVVSLPCMQTK